MAPLTQTIVTSSRAGAGAGRFEAALANLFDQPQQRLDRTQTIQRSVGQQLLDDRQGLGADGARQVTAPGRGALQVGGLLGWVVLGAGVPLPTTDRPWVGDDQLGTAEELDHPSEDPGIQPLADAAVRQRVVAAVQDDVAAGMDLDPPRLDQLERRGWQRQQHRPAMAGLFSAGY
jgi:hypothetical protein